MVRRFLGNSWKQYHLTTLNKRPHGGTEESTNMYISPGLSAAYSTIRRKESGGKIRLSRLTTTLSVTMHFAVWVLKRTIISTPRSWMIDEILRRAGAATF